MTKKAFVIMVVVAILAVSTLAIGLKSTYKHSDSASVLERRFQQTITKTVSARYAVYLPSGYDSDSATAWPLILFLHGSGTCGDDIRPVLRLGPMGYARRTKDFPFIVVAPLCPSGEQWSSEVLDSLLDELQQEYPVDPNRIYLTGLSLGATGTWAVAVDHPERFAAIAPVSGRAIAVPYRLQNLPVWVFHGDKDNVIPIENSRLMVNSLRTWGNTQVKFTVYQGAGHAIWSQVYSNKTLYDWFLAHKRQ